MHKYTITITIGVSIMTQLPEDNCIIITTNWMVW